MRAVVQRVRSAEVHVGPETTGRIHHGLLVFLGVEGRDTPSDAEWTARKVSQMRIFDDAQGLMNLDVTAAGGDLLVVSQFTLFAGMKKGTRPSFQTAARPEQAIPLYEAFITHCQEFTGKPIATGRFGADMQVTLVNDGPVTILLDSHLRE